MALMKNVNIINLSMRGRRLRTIIFYGVLFYILYCIFLTEDPAQITETAQGLEEAIQTPIEHAQQIATPSDSNIIVKVFSYFFSIIPWAFSILWSIAKFFWSILAFAWNIIGHIWTVFILAINVAYILIIFWTHNRRMPQRSINGFFQTMGIYLLIPLVVNWLLVRRQMAFNLLLPIYLTMFVAALGTQPDTSDTIPRNLVFFGAVCAFF